MEHDKTLMLITEHQFIGIIDELATYTLKFVYIISFTS